MKKKIRVQFVLRCNPLPTNLFIHTHANYSPPIMDFIPLVTDDYRVAFCVATNCLPNDIKQIIYKKTLSATTSEPPSAPKKITPSPRLARLMTRWKGRQLYTNN
ncbi:hypothetical protein N9C10_02930 [Flavobacteriaceae bacterium]|nr:hypothetical protein [Flavobacteriaceae bacterium]